MASMPEEQHPITSAFLFIALSPADARPTLQTVIHALEACVPFRFHHRQDSDDKERPRFSQVEFQQLETAQKAYAIIQDIKLRPAAEDTTNPVHLSLSIHEDGLSDTVPPEGTQLSVSELPSSHTSAAALYELFKPFGPIYRIETGPRRSTARVTYYTKTSSKAAEEELHFSEIDGMIISVCKPTKHDLKDSYSFKNPSFPIGGERRAVSAVGSSTNTTDVGNGVTSSNTGGGVNAFPKKTYNYASGHRATCGFGYKPYGLSSGGDENTSPRSPTSPTGHTAQGQPLHSEVQALRAPLVFRSTSHPVKRADPCQLIIQNIPVYLNAQGLYISLRKTFDSSPSCENIKLLEATIALDAETGESQGIAVIRLENAQQAGEALKRLNEAYLVGYEQEEAGSMPLRVKLFEPRGIIEKGLQLKEKHTNGSSRMAQGEDRSSTTGNVTDITMNTPPISPPSASMSSDISSSCKPQTKRSKHRKLLSISLDDLSDSNRLYTSEDEKSKLLDLLVDKLPEQERERCILEEKYLKKRCEALRELYWDMEGNEEHGGKVEEPSTAGNGRDNEEAVEGEEVKMRYGSESPTRLYDRKELLSLYTPHSPVHEKTEAMIRALSPTTETRSLPSPSSPKSTRFRRPKQDLKHQGPIVSPPLPPTEPNTMTLDMLVRFSVKGIMELASSENPPPALRGRSEESVKMVKDFLTSIRELKEPQQKQKIGERVFKIFKTQAGGMKNVSRRTITLLDHEDLKSLMHLTEEFPEILIAKAMSLEV